MNAHPMNPEVRRRLQAEIRAAADGLAGFEGYIPFVRRLSDEAIQACISEDKTCCYAAIQTLLIVKQSRCLTEEEIAKVFPVVRGTCRAEFSRRQDGEVHVALGINMKPATPSESEGKSHE